MCPYARTAWHVQKHRLAAVPAELVAHDHASVSTAGLTSNVVFSRPVLATQSFPGPQSLMPLAVPSSQLLWPLFDRFQQFTEPLRKVVLGWSTHWKYRVLQVPWLGKRTDELVRKANNAIRLAYFARAVRPVYRTTRAFSLPKDCLPTLSQSNLIYLYECRNCGKRYVGRTEQRLADRIDQHVPKHIITEPEPGKKTRGRPPKERSNPAEGYDSAIACHLAANKKLMCFIHVLLNKQ